MSNDQDPSPESPAGSPYPSYPGSDAHTPPNAPYGAPPPGYPPPGYAATPPEGYWQPPGAYGPYGYAAVPQPPKHPSATTAMVLGIVSVAGTFMCYFPAFAGPFAWYLGHKSMREIDASGGQLAGRSEAKAGMILGIIGTVLLVLLLAVIALLVVLTIAVEDFWDDEYQAAFKLIQSYAGVTRS